MRRTGGAVVTASVASLILVATVYAGGWMIMTLRDLPEYAVAGRPIQLTFMVREHGVSPLDGLTPKIAAKSGTKVVETSAVAAKSPGEYTATLALPDPGSWTIEFDPTDFVLPELTVIAPGSSAPPPLSEPSLGERLFVAKGCIGCHINREIEARNLYDIGPDLTGKRFPETYLKRLLVDPKSTLRRDSEPDREEMPNLGLTTAEIAALTAFINRDRPLRPRSAR